MTTDEILNVAGTHVVLMARCPGLADMILFESGNEKEPVRLCDEACLLLGEREHRAEMSQTIWSGKETV